MGKGGGGGSWLTSVKRAFRSPSKDAENNRKSTRRKEDQSREDQDNEDVKKKDKRRWIFKKLSVTQEKVSHPKVATSKATCDAVGGRDGNANVVADNVSAAAEAEQQRNAIAMAVATAAAAEAAVATVKAAAEVARLSRPLAISNYCAREHYAAIVIQTAFRGYLARRALRALKGLVKLQALVRGHNVRKQAKMTLKCMQALVRVQARVLDQRMRLSSHDGSRQSTFSDTNSMLKSRYRQDISDRRSMSRDGSSIADGWDERPHTIEEVKAMLQHRKDAALKREKTLSQAFSQQIWRTGRSPSIGSEGELLQERPQWLDRWMATKPWDSNTINSRARASTDHRDSIKTVEIDTSQPYSYLAPNFRRTSNNQFQAANPYHQRVPNSHSNVSPLHGAHQTTNPYRHSPITPCPSKSRPIQVRSASPRCQREDRSCSSSQTPSLRSNYYYSRNLNQHGKSGASGSSTLPNYMAATESAKARLRSQSAPRQRPSTPERDRIGSAKKRLSFPAPDPCGVGMGYNGGGGGNYYGNGLKSPSFKSVSHFGGLEEQSNYSSCCTESLGGEFSPSSTTDLRRWLR